ncbi:MAG TPA: site-specific integrase, partial [Desulfobacterales bacterium]|nr:site-specific integrase [Desulfobacterales bacterium]
CGLRRSEVLKLMIDDLHEMPPAVLLIRPNFARTLKTKSSVRQIPLSALLEPDELDDLIQFLNRRLYQEHKSGYSDFLFAMPDNLNPIAPEVRVFSIITETMRRVTGDPSPKFHHLRHSFASWSLFRLMLAASKAGRDVQLPNMPITTTYLNNSVRFSKRLLGAHFPTRKYVRAVAGLLGHSGPESSIPHYIHFSDLLLKLMLAKSLPCNGHTALTTLLNVHRTTSYRWYKRDGLDGLMKNFRKKMAGKRLVVNQKITANMKDIDSNVDMPVPSEVKFIYKVWTYLRLSSRSGAKSDEIQTRLAISNNQCRQFEDCIGAMKKRQAPNRQGTPFLWIYEILDLRVPDRKIESKGIQGPCTREYEDIVKRFIPLVWNLFRTDYDLTCTVLKLFLNNTWGSESGIIFRGFKEAGLARRYIKFLKLLGLRKDQIKLYSYDYNSKRSRCCGKWFRLLNLNKSDRIVKRLPPFASESKAVNEWLRVDVKLLPGAKTGSSAFRFLMTMSLICLDFPGKYD